MNNKKLGRNIRDLREDAGLTQADLATVIGVSQQQISTWERGQDMSLSNIEKIAKGIGTEYPTILLEGVFE